MPGSCRSRSRVIELLTVRAAADPILRFENVSKAFQGQIVLGNLSLEMRRGEFLTLLGPSGCGKTTSLNLVAGLIQPDRARCSCAASRPTRLPPRRRGLGTGVPVLGTVSRISTSSTTSPMA